MFSKLCCCLICHHGFSCFRGSLFMLCTIYYRISNCLNVKAIAKIELEGKYSSAIKTLLVTGYHAFKCCVLKNEDADKVACCIAAGWVFEKLFFNFMAENHIWSSVFANKKIQFCPLGPSAIVLSLMKYFSFSLFKVGAVLLQGVNSTSTTTTEPALT
jgi:hypothetical protein